MLTPDKRICFGVGNYVFLEVSHMRSVWRFNMKGKLAPRYVGPFQMLEMWNEVAYQIELPESLGAVYEVFHVSQPNKYLCVREGQILLKELTDKEDFTYKEYPIRILETAESAPKRRLFVKEKRI